MHVHVHVYVHVHENRNRNRLDILKIYLKGETVMQPLDISNTLSPWVPGVFGLFAFTFSILVMMILLMFLISWLGEKKPGVEKMRAYESGIIPTGTARLRYPVPFFLVAIFFMIFDVEGAFIFSWAVAVESLGWKGLAQMAFFIFVLLLGLVYIWRKGGLALNGKTDRNRNRG